jgi:hypothetical protein
MSLVPCHRVEETATLHSVEKLRAEAQAVDALLKSTKNGNLNAVFISRDFKQNMLLPSFRTFRLDICMPDIRVKELLKLEQQTRHTRSPTSRKHNSVVQCRWTITQLAKKQPKETFRMITRGIRYSQKLQGFTFNDLYSLTTAVETLINQLKQSVLLQNQTLSLLKD